MRLLHAHREQLVLPLHGRAEVRAIVPDTSEESIQRAIETLLASGASDATRQVLAKAKTPQELVALTLGSPEFQKR